MTFHMTYVLFSERKKIFSKLGYAFPPGDRRVFILLFLRNTCRALLHSDVGRIWKCPCICEFGPLWQYCQSLARRPGKLLLSSVSLGILCLKGPRSCEDGYMKAVAPWTLFFHTKRSTRWLRKNSKWKFMNYKESTMYLCIYSI